MIWVAAHAGHWLVQVAYVAPLVLLAGILVANQLRERRERREGAAGSEGSPDPPEWGAGGDEPVASDSPHGDGGRAGS